MGLASPQWERTAGAGQVVVAVQQAPKALRAAAGAC